MSLMNLNNIILGIIILWVLSEIILAGIKHSGGKSPDLTDRNSLGIIWITIAVSTTLGWLFGASAIGRIYGYEYVFRIVSLILITTGILIRSIAIITLNKYFTVDVAILSDHRIVKKGMYKYIRHPSYTGSLLSFAGLALFWCNWVCMIVIFLPIFAVFSYRINVEEKALMKNFGDEYAKYANETKKLVPGIY